MARSTANGERLGLAAAVLGVPAAVSIGVVYFVGLVLAAPLLAIALDIRRELKASGFFDEPETDPAGG